MADDFGLNDKLLNNFGLNDALVGQAAVTQPPVKPGVGQVANASRYVPKKPQYSQVYTPSEDVPGAMTGMGPTRPVQNYTDQQMQGAEQGVNIDEPAPISTVRASLARTKQMADTRIAQELQRKFGNDLQIRMGADSKTGNVEYFDQDAKQWKMVNESVGGKAINAIPATGEAIGALAGSYLPGPPGVMTAIGAGGGRTLGQWIKNSLGSDVADDPRDNQPAINAGLESTAINLGLNAITGGIPLAYRLAVRGKDVVPSAEAAESIMNSYQANKRYVDEIERSTGRKYEGNIAKIASLPDKNGMVNPNALELAANEPLLIRYPELAKREVTRRANKENVIELYWQNEAKNPAATSNITQANWQSRVKQIYDAFKEGRLGPYQRAAEDAVDMAQQAARENPTMGQLDTTQIANIAREAVIKAQTASKAKETAKWAAYEDAAGYIPGRVASPEHQVPLDDMLATTMRMFKDLKDKALLKSQVSQAERYTPRIEQTAEEAADDKALFESLGTEFKKGGTVDLAVLDRTIKDLNKEANTAAKGTIESDMSDANRNFLLTNLKKARETYLADKPELATALSEAQAETARHAREFKDSFLSTFLVRDNAYGAMRLADPALLDSIMTNGDKLGAQQLADLVRGEPGGQKAIVDYINAYYEKHFTKKLKDGKSQLDLTKHNKFVDEVLPNLRPFLNDNEYKNFSRLGGIAQEVIGKTEQWKLAQKEWAKTDMGRTGAKLSSETLVNQFFNGDKGDGSFNFIRRFLGNDALKSTQDGIMAHIIEKSRSSVTGKLDVNKLAGMINPIRGRFEEYFGAQKLNALDNLIKTAQEDLVNTSGPAILSGDTFLSRAAKPILGPLSAENRKITFLKDLRSKNIAAKVETAMYDENELNRLAREIRARRPDAERKARINAALTQAWEAKNGDNGN